MKIRTALGSDEDGMNRVYGAAFPREEREIVAKLAVDLLVEQTTPEIFSLVAEAESTIAGHVAFSPITLKDAGNCTGYILAPLAVAPEHQKQGIGAQLVKNGIQQLSQAGIDLLLVYGDPRYYNRFGFSQETAKNYNPPYALQYPLGWQGLMLSNCPPAQSPVQITCVPALCDPAMW